MKTYFEKELIKLQLEFKNYTKMVMESFHKSIQSLEKNNNQLAEQVISGDEKIDQLEVEIEESCLKILALYQPVAKDLRQIIAILKINDELERIADLGCNVAVMELRLDTNEPFALFPNLPKMQKIVEEMLEKSVNSIFTKDEDLAKSVILLDKEVNRMHKENYKAAEDLHTKKKCKITDIFALISVSSAWLKEQQIILQTLLKIQCIFSLEISPDTKILSEKIDNSKKENYNYGKVI